MEREPNLNGELMITQIETEQLPKVWPIVRPGILDILRRSGPVDFAIADILREVANNRSPLFVIEYREQYAGVLILRYFQEEFKPIKYLHVWAMYLTPESQQAEDDLVAMTWNFVEQEARRFGAKYVQVISDRKGWGRRLKKFGFEVSPFRAYRREM